MTAAKSNTSVILSGLGGRVKPVEAKRPTVITGAATQTTRYYYID